MIVADHDYVLKDLASYPVSGMINVNHENTSVRLAGLRAEFSNTRP
jgi:hypothetical protein